MKELTREDYQVMYDHREVYEEFESMEGNDNVTGYSIVYLDGKVNNMAYRANAKEGWIEVPVIINFNLDAYDPNIPMTAMNICDYDKKDGELVFHRVYGDVHIIKCDQNMHPISIEIK